jgi:predicted ATP-grasp superfamily ATP-dependent carboligase
LPGEPGTTVQAHAMIRPVADTDVGSFDTSIPLVILKIGRYPLHHGGVGAIRSLGRGGVPVYTMTEDRLTPAAVSRHLRGAFVAKTTGQEDDATLLDLFERVGRWIGRRAIALPTDDEAASFVAEHADELAARFLIPRVPPHLPRRLSSKRGLHETCLELGVPAPSAAFPASLHEVVDFAATAHFPVVAKNVDPWLRLQAPAVPNSTLVRSPEALLELAARWPADPRVMLQEYIPNDDAEDWIFHGYADESSRCPVAFTGVKYRSWPPRAGVTSYARMVANEELARRSSELLRRLGYRGIADLDWRFDRRDQEYKLLDFNPRVGAQFRLFETTTGIDVVRALHLDLTGRPIPNGDACAGRGFRVEYLDEPAFVAARLFGLRAASPVPHAPGRVEPAWFASDDPLPVVAAAVRSAEPLALRVRRLGRTALRRLQAATGRRPATIAAMIRRDANSVPYTNRSNGPNVAAAVSPVKYRPETEDWNDPSSKGASPVRRTRVRIPGLRKPSRPMSTR